MTNPVVRLGAQHKQDNAWTLVRIATNVNLSPAEAAQHQPVLKTADINKDGFQDVVTGRAFYLNPGTTYTSAWKRILPHPDAHHLQPVTVDFDGNPDLLGQIGDTLYWFESLDPEGIRWTHQRIYAPADTLRRYHVLASEANHPLEQHPIFIGNSAGILSIDIPKTPESTQWHTEQLSNTPLNGLQMCDINNDTFLDLVGFVSNPDGSSTLQWLENPQEANTLWKVRSIARTKRPLQTFVLLNIHPHSKYAVVYTERAALNAEKISLNWLRPKRSINRPRWRRSQTLSRDTTRLLPAACMLSSGEAFYSVENDTYTAWSLNGRIWDRLPFDPAPSFTDLRVLLRVDIDNDGDRDILGIASPDTGVLLLWINPSSTR